MEEEDRSASSPEEASPSTPTSAGPVSAGACDDDAGGDERTSVLSTPADDDGGLDDSDPSPDPAAAASMVASPTVTATLTDAPRQRGDGDDTERSGRDQAASDEATRQHEQDRQPRESRKEEAPPAASPSLFSPPRPTAAVQEATPTPATSTQRADATTVTPAVAVAPPKKPAADGDDGGKVKVHFVAVGNAPILKRAKFKIDADRRFAYVTSSLRRTLKLGAGGGGADDGRQLFLYCNAAFVPCPDQRLGDLRDCFSVRDELVVHYSLKEAWG